MPQRLYKSGKGSTKVPRGAVLIYDDLEEIRATKGKRSHWPNQPFKHKFEKRRTKVYGLPNGNLLIVGPRPLWDIFRYSDK